jgi:tetrahydromethanopterin S-methyltransferase subunit F
MTAGGHKTVASFDTYADAERAVDYLSDHDFPVEHVAIVGRDLRYVEHVTGRLSRLDATLRGVVVGGLTGVLIGWLFAAFNWFNPLIASGWLVFDGLWFGMLVGAFAGFVGHLMTGGRRDFSSVRSMIADRYELIVHEPLADQAERLLAEMKGAAPEPVPAT